MHKEAPRSDPGKSARQALVHCAFAWMVGSCAWSCPVCHAALWCCVKLHWKGKGLMCCSLSKRQGLLGYHTAALRAVLYFCAESSEFEQERTFYSTPAWHWCQSQQITCVFCQAVAFIQIDCMYYAECGDDVSHGNPAPSIVHLPPTRKGMTDSGLWATRTSCRLCSVLLLRSGKWR